MDTRRNAILALTLLLVLAGCAPYPYNDYYSEYQDDYYGGYPYTSSAQVNHYYYGGSPYYYWNSWYGYPWYWYDHGHDHDDDDDDDHHHRPPPPNDQERAQYLLDHRSDPAELSANDIDRHREDIRDLPINMADRRPLSASNRRVMDKPRTQSFRQGAPSRSFNKPASPRIRWPRRGVSRSASRGDQWQK